MAIDLTIRSTRRRLPRRRRRRRRAVGAASTSTASFSSWLAGHPLGRVAGCPRCHSCCAAAGFGASRRSSCIIAISGCNTAILHRDSTAVARDLVCYRPLARLRSVPAPRRTQRGPYRRSAGRTDSIFLAPQSLRGTSSWVVPKNPKKAAPARHHCSRIARVDARSTPTKITHGHGRRRRRQPAGM